MKVIRNSNFLVLSIIISCTIGCKTVKIKSVSNLPLPIATILKTNYSRLDSVSQLILVCNDNTQKNEATLTALEKIDNQWYIKFDSIKAYVGLEGFAEPGRKHEGDMRTPQGFFRLGRLFTYESKVDTKMPYMQVTKEDKWIDDAGSDDYNKYVRGETDAESYENLLLDDYWYKYCMVIEYNTNPIVKGKGCAIFFHLGDGPTYGCVAISERGMLEILNWFEPDKKPSILMGKKEVLSKWK